MSSHAAAGTPLPSGSVEATRFGLALGIFVLGEQVQWTLFVGTALVAAGIVIVNGRQVLSAMSARRHTPATAQR